MMSRWPSVVSMPTTAPFFSSSALVATVVPWTTSAVSRSSASRSRPSSEASRRSPSITPSDGSDGVEAAFARATRPESSTATTSVNVPPTSIPMRSILAAPRPGPRDATAARGRGRYCAAVALGLGRRRAATATRLDRRLAAFVPGGTGNCGRRAARAPWRGSRLARLVAGTAGCHEPVGDVGAPRRWIALGRRAVAPTSRRLDVEHRAGRDRNPDLFGGEESGPASGDHPVAVRLSIQAAQDAVRGVPDPVARRVAPGRLFSLHSELEPRAHTASKAPVTRRVRPEFVELEEQRKARLGHLDAAELDAAGGLTLAGGLPAVAGD